MSFVRKIVDGLQGTYVWTETPGWFWDNFGGTATKSGQKVSADTALGLIPVWAAVRLLASSVGSLPLIVYQGQGRDRDRAKDSQQWELLHDEPNPESAADQVWETVMGHLNLWGNAYLEKAKDSAGVVGELWPMNPARVQVGRDRQRRKVFEVDGNQGRSYDESEILHIPAWSIDGLTGLSPITYAREYLGAILARDAYYSSVYKNQARPGGFVKVKGMLTKERSDRLRDHFESGYSGENVGRTAILEGDTDWIQATMPLKDQQFVEVSRFTITEIARLFGVPPEMIGGDRDSSMTYSTVEGQALAFVKFSLTPWLVRIENALWHDKDLFPDRDIYPEFLVDGLLRGDSKTRAEVNAIEVGLGIKTRNEARQQENRPPVEGGDEIQQTMPGAAPNVLQAAHSNGDMLERLTTSGAT